MEALAPGQAGPHVVIMMEAARGPVCVAQELVITPPLNVVASIAMASVWKSPTAPETERGLPGLPGLPAAPAAASVSRSVNDPAATRLLAMVDECVWARTVRRDTVMNTCPAHRTSTGRPGRHGNAALCPVAEASSHDAEPVRTAMTVPGVARSTSHATLCHVLT